MSNIFVISTALIPDAIDCSDQDLALVGEMSFFRIMICGKDNN